MKPACVYVCVAGAIMTIAANFMTSGGDDKD